MLKGKVAIITGGTRGIGFAIVRTYLKNRAQVILLGSRKETVDKAIEKLKKENGDFQVDGMSPNLSDFTQVEQAFKEVYEKYGKIDILVNNVGISARESIYDYKAEDFKKIMELNVIAMFNCSKAVAPIMRAAGGGAILNTSSMVSRNGQSSGVGYPASKFAVNGITLSLARELGKDGIRVNAVAPGVIETDMLAALPKEMREAVIKPIPLGRVGQPQDIANAFLFLASDLASYVSGEILSVNGAHLV